jgi:PHD/YefM family antitoxin component YafN of YafNO toxin-antitoxin module
MHNARDTYSLTDFKQNAQEHLERLRASGLPEVLTVNGRAEAVLMTPEAYDRLIDLAFGDVRSKVAEGLRQARAGQLIDGDEALRARRARRAARRGDNAR